MTYEEREIIKIDGGRAQQQRDDVKSCFSRIKKNIFPQFSSSENEITWSHGYISRITRKTPLNLFYCVFTYIFSLETNYDGEYLNLAGNAKN